MVGYGTARYGVLRIEQDQTYSIHCGMVRFGSVGYGLVRRGQAWLGPVWYGEVRYGLWFGEMRGSMILPMRAIPDRPRVEVDVTSTALVVTRELCSFTPTQVDSTSLAQQITHTIPKRPLLQIEATSSAPLQRRPYWLDHPGERSYAPVSWALKQLVLERDNWTCVYCLLDLKQLSSSNVDIDHRYPRADGGPSLSLTNLASSCRWCNRGKNGKHRRTPEEWEQWRRIRGLPWPPEQHQNNQSESDE
jgi:hypothetical protein